MASCASLLTLGLLPLSDTGWLLTQASLNHAMPSLRSPKVKVICPGKAVQCQVGWVELRLNLGGLIPKAPNLGTGGSQEFLSTPFAGCVPCLWPLTHFL